MAELYLGHISAISRLYLGYISAVSRLHLGCISAVSRLYLGCISAASRQTMIHLCHELLEQRDVESAIRVGDVYALMVEWYYSQQQMEQAYSHATPIRLHAMTILTACNDYSTACNAYLTGAEMEQAYSLVEKMRGRSIILSPYLDHEMVHHLLGDGHERTY